MKLWPCLLLFLTLSAHSADVEWRVNGGPDNIRYSALQQIAPGNVAGLRVAWTYDSHDAFKDSEMQSNPIVADGILRHHSQASGGGPQRRNRRRDLDLR